MNNLGLLYENGRGVVQDYAKRHASGNQKAADAGVTSVPSGLSARRNTRKAEGWGREEWGIANWIFLGFKELG
jgi:hypothetical protein